MLDLDDDRWTQLLGGYQVTYDCRPALDRLGRPDSRAGAWEELWENLHHQGDIGSASLAAIPHIVKISEQFDEVDWNLYALPGLIEELRLEAGFEVPSWLSDAYFKSLEKLALRAASDLQKTEDYVEVTSALAIIALSKGMLIPGRLLQSYSLDELYEMERKYTESA